MDEKHMSDHLFWPLSFDEMDLVKGTRRMEAEDIASYAYPPWAKERYTPKGWAKATSLMIDLGIPVPFEELDVRDFGAVGTNDRE